MRTRPLISIILFTSLFALGCASKPVETNSEPETAQLVGGGDPSGPPTVFAGDRSMAEESASITPEKQTSLTGFELTLKRMARNPLTTYRSQHKAYSFYIGNLLEAELELEKGLTLRKGTSQQNTLVCQYNLEGGLNSVSADPTVVKDKQRACADLMFTFDQQLGE